RDPREDTDGRDRLRGAFLGAVVTAILSMIVIPFVVGLGAWIGTSIGGVGGAMAGIASSIILAGILFSVVRYGAGRRKRDPRPFRQGFATGMWIGVGVAVLLDGLCFAGLSGMR